MQSHLLNSESIDLEQAKILNKCIEFIEGIKSQTDQNGNIIIDKKRVEVSLKLINIPQLVKIIEELEQKKNKSHKPKVFINLFPIKCRFL